MLSLRIIINELRTRFIVRNKFKRVSSQIERIEGWLVPGQEFWLFSAAYNIRDGARIVEIGSYKGRSSVCLGLACRGTRKHVYSIDRWQGVYQDVESTDIKKAFSQGFFEEWQGNITTNDLQDYVTPLVGNSADIARVWRAPIDMIFVDGSHKFEDVIEDFENYYPHVVPEGLMAFHDVTPEWEGSFRAWNDHIAPCLRTHGQYSTISFGYK
jgi:predicted O-methyltransferase YrrM